MDIPRLPTIPMERRYGGPLNWFDYLDADFRVPIEFFGKPYPKTAKQQEAWLIEMLRSHNTHEFFGRLLSRKGLALDFQVTKVRKTGWPDQVVTIGTVPLAQFLSLPNERPAEELAQMKEFLTWLDDQLNGQGKNEDDAALHVYRGGYNHRGMGPAYFKDDHKKEALAQALLEWRKKPWFKAWYEKMMEHLGRVRAGPHCWFTLTHLQGDRKYFRLMAEYDEKRKQSKGEA